MHDSPHATKHVDLKQLIDLRNTLTKYFVVYQTGYNSEIFFIQLFVSIPIQFTGGFSRNSHG